MKRKILFSIFLTLCHQTLQASTDDEQRVWLGVFAKKELKPTYSIWEEIQFRYGLTEGEMQQTLARIGLLKKFNIKHESGFLMAYSQTDAQKEYRPTLQHTYTHSLEDASSLSLRGRLEYRDIENEDDNSVRFRTMINYRKKINSHISPLIWDELFLNLTKEDWTGEQTFERNRAFVGIRIDQSTHYWEFGYMNQFIPKNDKDSIEHILTGYLYF